MEKVVISPFVINKLESLILVLFEKEYFGFMESAVDYVDNIYDFILLIPSQKKKRTKKQSLVTGTAAIKQIAKQLSLLLSIMKMMCIS